MKRSIIFILICLVFGAAMSVAVAWVATLGEWIDEEEYANEENGWKAAIWSTAVRTSIHAISENSTEEMLEYRHSPTGLDKLEKVELPSWYSLSLNPTNDDSELRGYASGWPMKCVYFVQENRSGPFYLEWDFKTYGGIVGTNPFYRDEDYAWNMNHLPLRVLPIGLLANAIFFSSLLVFPVLLFRFNLRQRARYHQRHKRCPYCKYDISRATSAVCSECGVDSQVLPQLISKGSLFVISGLTIVLVVMLTCFCIAFAIKPPYSQLHRAAWLGDLEEVRNQIESGADLDSASGINENSLFAFEFTPLSLAVSRNHTEIARLLIESGADLESPNSLGTTALHTAIEEGVLESIDLLIDAGADVNADVNGSADALFFIANHDDLGVEILEAILEAGYRFESKSKKLDIAFYFAIKNENNKLINRLLELGAVPGYGVLRAATGSGRVDLLEHFAEHGSEFINIPNNYWPLLHNINVEHNPRETFLFLLDQGVEIDARDIDGSTALMYAAQVIEPELVQMYLEFGADPNLRNIDGMNALDLPLDWAAGSLKIRDPEGKLMKIVQMLLDAGVEVQLVDNKGEPRFWDLDPMLEEFLKEHVAKNSKEKQSDE